MTKKSMLRALAITAAVALAEWAAKETNGVKWVFFASSGHELNFRGTNAYLNSDRIPRPEDVYLWTHLGASLINYDYIQNADGTLTRTSQPPKQSIKYVSDNAARCLPFGGASRRVAFRLRESNG